MRLEVPRLRIFPESYKVGWNWGYSSRFTFVCDIQSLRGEVRGDYSY